MKNFFTYIAFFIITFNVLMATTKVMTDKPVELWSYSGWIALIVSYIVGKVVADALDKR
mgnify:CR=1 FL=1